MPLAPGTRLGVYEVTGAIGAGELGEVYRARDHRLGRDVALKVLSQTGRHTAGRLERFEREARVLGSLNHPHIATIFGLEEAPSATDASATTCALVLEFIEGPTLGERLTSGPIEVDEALSFACQIAEALEAAHTRGIVHRDLKPANIKLTAAGAVKVLDFGVAKLIGPTAPDGSIGPTVTATQTREGAVVGTIAYMSPEQARGVAVDTRADVWAFGCVLYELLTGQRAFTGDTVSDVVVAVLEREPDWSRLPSETPDEVRRLLLRCLTKDPRQRLRDIGDARLDLVDVIERRRAPWPLSAPHARRNAMRGSSGPGAARRWAIPVAVLGGIVVATALLWLGAQGVWRPAPAPEPIRSLAVLPLSNLSGDETQDYFSDGMTEALISALARISALRVTSRTSIMQYKNAKKPLPRIAQELGVEGIVEGSVVREGSRVRITAQLIHASSDRHLWSDSYERDLVDVLLLQQQVARAIAEQVRVRLTPAEERTLQTPREVLPVAQDAYLRGLHLFNTSLTTADRTGRPELLARSLSAFEEAIRLEPDWAQPWAALARSRHWVASFGDAELYPAAKAAALKALELDDSNAEAHAALAFVLQRSEWDWAGAERAYKRAIQLNPSLGNNGHHGYALLLQVTGRLQEAEAIFKIAEALDPLVVPLKTNAAYAAVVARRYDEALERSRRAIEVYGDTGWAYETIGRARTGQGRGEEALAAFRRFQELSPGPEATASVACGLAMTGRHDEAMRIASSLARQLDTSDAPPIDWWDVATAYACLDERPSALDALERAFAGGVETLPGINVDPWLQHLRSEPRFQALLRKMNLPPASAH